MNTNVPVISEDGWNQPDDMAPAESGGSFLEVAKSKSAQEVQAMVIMAKKFPRNQIAAERRILDACKRKGLAESALYSFPRGGQTVEGPSIRMAEVLAQNWGNLDSGVIELDRADGVSTMMAYCWDLETNVRQTKVFSVAHVRDTKRGGKRLTDERDVYEMTANQGSRRLRSCILAVIPGDIVDAAVAQVEATMKNAAGAKPMKDRIREMVKQFESYGVTQELIEKRLNHHLSEDKVTETEMANLRKIFASIKDGMAKAEDFFDLPKAQPAEEAGGLKSRVQAQVQNGSEKNANDPVVTVTKVDSFTTEDPRVAVGNVGLFNTQDPPKLKGPNT